MIKDRGEYSKVCSFFGRDTFIEMIFKYSSISLIQYNNVMFKWNIPQHMSCKRKKSQDICDGTKMYKEIRRTEVLDLLRIYERTEFTSY